MVETVSWDIHIIIKLLRNDADASVELHTTLQTEVVWCGSLSSGSIENLNVHSVNLQISFLPMMEDSYSISQTWDVGRSFLSNQF